MIDEPAAIGQEIARHWGPVFGQREVDPDIQQQFLDFVPPQTTLDSWDWPRGHWRDDITHLHEAAPRPGGLPYVF